MKKGRIIEECNNIKWCPHCGKPITIKEGLDIRGRTIKMEVEKTRGYGNDNNKNERQ